MSRMFFKNPVLESREIKQYVLYKLDEESTDRLLKLDRKNAMKNTGRYMSFLDPYTETTDNFRRGASGEARGRKYRMSESLIHHYDSDFWGNRMYAMYYEQPRPKTPGIFFENYGIYNPKGPTDEMTLKEDIPVQNVPLRLKEMICFFTKFAPLAPLGYSILWRLNGEDTRIPILVHGQSPFLPFKQENIYRCLLAVTNGFLLKEPAGKGVPKGASGRRVRAVDFAFRNNFLLERDKDPFVLLEDPDGRRYWYELPGDSLLEFDKASVHNAVRSPKMQKYHVTVRASSETEDYIGKKTRRIWKPEDRKENKTELYSMVYYPEKKPWTSYYYTYVIPQEEEADFRRYIHSFGDFAFESDCNPVLEESEKAMPQDFCFSLCTPYNSEQFFEKFRRINGGDIPALTNMELYWLEFILLKYPNFCRMFLNGKEEYGEKETSRTSTYWKVLAGVQERIRELRNGHSSDRTYRNIFWRDRYFEESYFDQKVRDLASPNVAKKYGTIYSGIKESRCFTTTGKNGGKIPSIIPYALNFNVADYLINAANQGENTFAVMAYSLSEKRTVLISYSNIFASGDSLRLDEYTFSEADLWYHLAAFFMRVDNRAGRKRTAGTWEEEFCKSYECCEKFMGKIDGGMELLEKAFAPMKEAVTPDEDGLSLNRRELQRNGVELFSEEEGRYRTRILNTFQNIYKRIPSGYLKKLSPSCRDLLHELHQKQDLSAGSCKVKQLFFEMIMGSRAGADRLEPLRKLEGLQDVTGLFLARWRECASADERNSLNEITYTNSVLKRKSIIFSLKEKSEAALDRIYEYFRGYNCIGFWNSEKEEIHFELEYERFNFRKIHELVLALRDTIEVVGPKETLCVIRQRLKTADSAPEEG